jgi:hypothetical protein
MSDTKEDNWYDKMSTPEKAFFWIAFFIFCLVFGFVMGLLLERIVKYNKTRNITTKTDFIGCKKHKWADVTILPDPELLNKCHCYFDNRKLFGCVDDNNKLHIK